MDPTANLTVQLRIARRLLKVAPGEPITTDTRALDAIELAEYVEALHDWLTKGGFLPDQWARPRLDKALAQP